MINLKYPVIITSFLSIIYCIFNIGYSKFPYIFLLPTMLFILSVLFNTIYKDYKKSIVFNIVIAQIIFRYCLLPVVLSTGEYFKNGYQSYNLGASIYIMLIEILSTFIIFIFFSKAQKASFTNRIINIKPINFSLFLFFVLMIMLYFIYKSGTFQLINPVWDLGEFVETVSTNKDELIYSSYGPIVFESFKILLSLLILSTIYTSKKIKSHNKKWLYLIVVLISNIFIIGLSRFSIVLFTLPLLLLVRNLLTNKDFNKVLIITGFSTTLAILTASLAKFTRQGNDATVDSFFSAYSLNAYFSGPGNIANGLDIYDNISFYDSVLFLINDTIQNIPLLSKISVEEYKLNIIFNENIYGHRYYADQIVPLSVSGAFHFGYLGVFFYSAIFLAISLLMERKSHKAKNLGYKYVYIYLSISLSLIFMLNIGSFYANISKSLLFIFLPVFITHIYSSIKIRS